jgi:flagellar biosynthetic protein FliR
LLDIESLQGAFLVLVRLTTFLFLMPFFSIKGTPSLIKIGFGVILTALISPTLIPEINNIEVPGVGQYAILLIKEALVGLILGYVSLLTFSAVRIAGGIIDIQMGLSMSTVFDPQTQSRTTVIEQFLYLFQILMFMAVDGHHTLLLAISYSYSLIPLAAGGLKMAMVPAVFQLFIQVISLGVRMAMPFIVVFLICDIALGIVARTVPQLNVFILSFPIKTGIGLITMAAVLPLIVTVINNIFTQMESDILMVMELMR